MEKLQKSFLILVSLFLLSSTLFAQNGTIRGVIIDGDNGETLIGVNVLVEGTGSGTATDIDGSFELSLAPGTYNLDLSYVSFEPLKVTDLVVKAGEVNLLENIVLQKESEILDEIVIKADVIRTSEAALMTIKRRSANLIDGISSSRFKKIGDSDAGAAVKRVTGVSVEGGKYVFVRGLGDRYTKTMLNSVDIPGLDPDRNSLQIDIFPTNLLNNMMVYKSTLAELPADFTGGLVNIETKDFPEKKIFDISFGLGFNPSMHFNSDYLTYDGGDYDWLGFDDGTRALPAGADQEVIPGPLTSQDPDDAGNFIRSFDRTLGTTRQTSLPNYSFGVSYGDQKQFENGHKLGYIFSSTYKSSRQYFDDVNYGEYQIQGNVEELEMMRAATTVGQIGQENVLVGGLAGLAYKTDKTKHKINLLHIQNGESKAGNFTIDNNSDAVGQSGFIAYSDNLEYSQRSLTNLLINGNYILGDGNDWEIDWKISPTISKLTDPDIRKTAFSEFGSNQLGFVAGAGGNPTRIWRYLDEINLVSKVDFSKKYQLGTRDAKLKFGASHLYKEREYNILSYFMQFFGSQPQWSGNPSEVLNGQTIFPEGNIYYVSGNNTPNPNQYNSDATNMAVYVANEFNPTESLKATVGLRVEKFKQHHTGRDATFENVLEDEVVLDATDFFPSVNLIQSLAEKQNLRFSYSRSIARPSFKELSFAQIIDPVSDRIFNGGLFQFRDQDGNVTWDGGLTETRINNVDLRWEMFQERGQIFSISGFYKSFNDAIELVRIPIAQTSNEFQPRNVGDGQVYGVEVEMRKNLPFVDNKINFSANVTLAKSSIEMTDLERENRLAFEKAGQVIGTKRQMAGQSPFIVNAGLTYNAAESPFNLGLYYNVKGRTLAIVGGGLFPDVYDVPFHSLNLSLNHAIGPDDKLKIGFNIDNILSSVRQSSFASFNAQDQIFSRFEPGMSFGLSLGYSIY